jgi:hypothetical protein
LTPRSDLISVNRDDVSIDGTPKPDVSAKTLSVVRRILIERSDDLKSYEKERIGKLCETTGLNKPPKKAKTNIDAAENMVKQSQIRSAWFEKKKDTESQKKNKSSNDTKKYKCKHCKSKFKSKSARGKHQSNCSKKSSSNPASGGSVGKSVKKDNRGERVTGKNPFADTDRLKDTGLHQGGG